MNAQEYLGWNYGLFKHDIKFLMETGVKNAVFYQDSQSVSYKIFL